MTYSVETKFPNEIDERVFFSDCDLTQVDVLAQYKELLNQEKYTEASDLLINSDINYYGSWILNRFENQLNAIGNYLLTKTKPQLQIYSYDVPIDVDIGMIWIGEEIE